MIGIILMCVGLTIGLVVRWRLRVRRRRLMMEEWRAWSWWQRWVHAWIMIGVEHAMKVPSLVDHKTLDRYAARSPTSVSRRVSAVRTDACPVWNPDLHVWEESDMQLRSRIKRKLAR